MGFALWIVGSDVVPLREEVHQLRNELGIFEIEDPSKIHAIRMETDDSSLSKFRVYLPEGARYHVNYAYSDIPEEGVPSVDGTTTTAAIEPGGYVISLRKNTRPSIQEGMPRRGTMVLRVKPTDGQNMSSGSTDVGVHGNWIAGDETGRISTRIVCTGREVELFAADGPVELYRCWAAPYSASEIGPDGETVERRYENADEPGEGFLVWIEAVEEDPKPEE